MNALTANQVEDLKAAFDAFDTDQSGSINAEKLREAMKTIGKEMSHKEVKQLISNVAANGSDEIGFNEFLEMMVMHMYDVSEEAEIERMFQVFDKDEDNFIGAAELRMVFLKMGEVISDDEVQTILRKADKDGDGKIGWHDFFDVMMQK